MGVHIEHSEMLGDGKTRVFARTDLGNTFDIVIRGHLLNSAEMWQTLEAAGVGRDKLAASSKRTVTATDSEE